MLHAHRSSGFPEWLLSSPLAPLPTPLPPSFSDAHAPSPVNRGLHLYLSLHLPFSRGRGALHKPVTNRSPQPAHWPLFSCLPQTCLLHGPTGALWAYSLPPSLSCLANIIVSKNQSWCWTLLLSVAEPGFPAFCDEVTGCLRFASCSQPLSGSHSYLALIHTLQIGVYPTFA